MVYIIKDNMYVYKTTNLVNGKMYIGKTKYDKPLYFGSGKLIQIAIKKILMNMHQFFVQIVLMEILLNHFGIQ